MSRLIASVLCGFVLILAQRAVLAQDSPGGGKSEFTTAEEAHRVGVAYYNSRNFKASRAPFEAAVRMAKDESLKLKAYQALLIAYREIPEFEPYQTAAEYVIQ